jgi:hypothetical protein
METKQIVNRARKEEAYMTMAMMKRKAKGSHILSSPPQVHKSFAKFTRV